MFVQSPRHRGWRGGTIAWGSELQAGKAGSMKKIPIPLSSECYYTRHELESFPVRRLAKSTRSHLDDYFWAAVLFSDAG